MAWGVPNPQNLFVNDWRSVGGWLRDAYRWIIANQAITTPVAAYTVAENIHYVRADATAGAYSVTIPAALGRDGREIIVTKVDSGGNVVTIARSGSDTFNGSTSLSLTAQWDSVTLISNGNNAWDVTGVGRPTSGAWTPVDASGAALTLTGAAGTWRRWGDLIWASGLCTYPVTADASNAAIGGLPFTCANNNQSRTGTLSYTTGATARGIIITANTTNASFVTAAGALVTNAQMSTFLNYFNFVYPAA